MYNEIKSIKEPTEEDCYLGIIRAYQREVDGLQQENKQLNEEIEEYKRIEQEDLKAFNNYDSILTELEEYLEKEWNITSKSPKGSFYEGYDTCMLEMKEDIQNKIQELKEKYK